MTTCRCQRSAPMQPPIALADLESILFPWPSRRFSAMSLFLAASLWAAQLLSFPWSSPHFHGQRSTAQDFRHPRRTVFCNSLLHVFDQPQRAGLNRCPRRVEITARAIVYAIKLAGISSRYTNQPMAVRKFRLSSFLPRHVDSGISAPVSTPASSESSSQHPPDA